MVTDFWKWEKPRNERIVEIPWVEKRIRGDKILDIGCCETKFALYLANKGYRVWGIDIKERYEFGGHKNFRYIKHNTIEPLPFESNFFDTVYALSSIEHVGLGFYNDPVDPDGDKKAMENIKKVVKTGGRILITIPYGRKSLVKYKGIKPFYRVYDSSEVERITRGLLLIDKQAFKYDNKRWVNCDLRGIENLYWEEGLSKAILCINLAKI